MATYNIEFTGRVLRGVLPVGLLRVGFSTPRCNDAIARDIHDKLERADCVKKGHMIFVDGPLSAVAAMIFGHLLGKTHTYVAVYDKELKSFVVVVANEGEYKVGDTIPPASLHEKNELFSEGFNVKTLY